jgi:predicted amidophosphoribosyltransferase
MAVDLVLPLRCAICGAEGAFLCGNCASGLEKLNELPVTNSTTNGSTLEIRSLWAMEDSARHLIHQFKYGGFKALARPLLK